MPRHHWSELICLVDGLNFCYDLYISCSTAILAIAKQCAVVVESKSQIYAHVYELLAKKEMPLRGRVKW